MYCKKHNEDIGFGIDCFVCNDCEPPEPNRSHPDVRKCIHEQYISEFERDV